MARFDYTAKQEDSATDAERFYTARGGEFDGDVNAIAPARGARLAL